jgi:hypothetical protein
MNVDSDNFTTDKHSGLADGPERNTVVSRESEAMDTIIPFPQSMKLLSITSAY